MAQETKEKTPAANAAEQQTEKQEGQTSPKATTTKAPAKKPTRKTPAKKTTANTKKATKPPAENTEQEQKLIKVKFTKPPFGKFKLPYYIDQEKELPEPLAREVIKAQYAVKV